MRDYGKVHTSFWSSDTLRDLPDDAKFLALYLLTCSHGNMAGVFRLPLAYITEDIGWVSERLNNGFQTLSDAGWACRCNKSGWIWIKNWAKWNRPDNPNQRKAVDKLLDQVPASVFFYSELMSPSKVSETVVQPLGNTPVPVTASVPVTALPKIPLEDGTEYEIPGQTAQEFLTAYPRLDLPAEVGKARAWCIANPGQRKTRRGASKFLNGWLSRAHERLPAVLAAALPAGGRRRL